MSTRDMMERSATGARPGRRSVERHVLAWTSLTLALTGLFLALLFVVACRVADRIHDDVGARLGAKLPLIGLHPRLVFAGDSRTAQQVDAALAAAILGRPPGYAVNIAAIGEDPLAVLGAARERPADFRNADLVFGLSPYHINDGSKREYFFAAAAIARMGLPDKLRTFLLDRPETLLWYIRDAFADRAWRAQRAARPVAMPERFGFEALHSDRYIRREAAETASATLPYRYRDFLNSEIGVYEGNPYYQGWRPDGFKAGLVQAALCELKPLVHRLVIFAPPWAPIPQFSTRPAWRALDDQFHDRMAAIAHQCGVEFLVLSEVPGLGLEDYADETHVGARGTEIYTRYLVDRLQRPRGDTTPQP